MKTHNNLLISLLLIPLLSGCGVFAPTSSTPTSTYPPPITTEPILATISPTAPKPNDTWTAVPYQPFEATIVFDNVFLREGPGFLFDNIGNYMVNQKVSVLGRAPGGFWLKVRTADANEGWMRVDVLELSETKYDAPEIEPVGGIILRGHVYAPNGTPATIITVMINPENATDTRLQDVAVTDFSGKYYFFLPPGLTGNWTIVANDWGCNGNNVTKTCALIGQFPPPKLITLPDAASDWIDLAILP